MFMNRQEKPSSFKIHYNELKFLAVIGTGQFGEVWKYVPLII